MRPWHTGIMQLWENNMGTSSPLLIPGSTNTPQKLFMWHEWSSRSKTPGLAMPRTSPKFIVRLGLIRIYRSLLSGTENVQYTKIQIASLKIKTKIWWFPFTHLFFSTVLMPQPRRLNLRSVVYTARNWALHQKGLKRILHHICFKMPGTSHVQ